MIAPVKAISNATTQITQSAPVKKVADEIQKLCALSPISITGETASTYLQKLLNFKKTCKANSMTMKSYKDSLGRAVKSFECITENGASPVTRIIKSYKGKCVEEHFVDCTNHAIIQYNKDGKVSAFLGSENGKTLFCWNSLK